MMIHAGPTPTEAQPPRISPGPLVAGLLPFAAAVLGVAQGMSQLMGRSSM
jgi:hypothetical protein